MMEVKCINCGLFFSVDDNLYKGEFENFCGVECHSMWLCKDEGPEFSLNSNEEKIFKLPLKEKE